MFACLTGPQLALSCVRQLSGKIGLPEIIPIPGATSDKRVVENMQQFDLSRAEVEEIDEILKSFEIVGDRYGCY